MAASYRALEREHHALLLAMLDPPPGPGGRARPRGGVAAAYARGLHQAPGDLIDRLTDHFLRVMARESTGCTRAGGTS